MRCIRRLVRLAGNDEPSNPFKNPRKSTSKPANSSKSGRRGAKSRKSSGPPAPPGGRKQSPPVAPSGSKTDESADVAKTPARAGKGVGLRKQSEKPKATVEKKTDQKARELIEAARTNIDAQPAKTETKPSGRDEPYNPFKKTQPKRVAAPQRRGGRGGRGGRRNKPQGQSKRVKKLHRGKYMEFKYDVRRILDEEDVADEHRSNVLGQTWAKGERQGVTEAKAFLEEKVEEGVITEECSSKIMKLIDSLTTRR